MLCWNVDGSVSGGRVWERNGGGSLRQVPTETDRLSFRAGCQAGVKKDSWSDDIHAPSCDIPGGTRRLRSSPVTP